MKRTLLLVGAVLAALSAGPKAQDGTDPSPYAQFVDAVQTALRLADGGGIDKALRESPEMAVRYFGSLCWKYQQSGEGADQEVIDQVRESWERVHKTKTLQAYEVFVSARGDEQREKIYELELSEGKLWEERAAAFESGDRGAYRTIYEKFAEHAKAYEELRLTVVAAEWHAYASDILRTMPGVTTTERREALRHLQEYVRMCEEWEFTVQPLFAARRTAVVSEAEQLAFADRQVEAAAQAAERAAGDDLSRPEDEKFILDLEFKAQTKPHVDCFFRGGEVEPLWLGTALVGPVVRKIPWFDAHEVYLLRDGAAKFGITNSSAEPDERTNPWVEVDANRKWRPTKFFLDADKERPYALWFFVGGQQEPLFGLNHNLQPLPEQATLYYRSAAAWEASHDGHRLTLFDDNCNGRLFDDVGEQLHRDFSRNVEKGVPVLAFDAMQVDGGPVQPLSEYVRMGDDWYRLRAAGAGQVSVRRIDPERFPTGSLQLEWSGAAKIRPEVLVVSGKGGVPGAYFNIAGKDSVEVPIGNYEVAFGRISSGRRGRMQQSHIYKGTMSAVEVRSGETSTMTLGGPFVVDFELDGDHKQAKISAASIAVTGVSGERYARINGATPTPEVVAARTAAGKGTKTIGTFELMDLDTMNATVKQYGSLGLEVAFFPLPKNERRGNLELTAKVPFDEAWVGLQQKRNKLFGELKPVWKKVPAAAGEGQ
ncbi:MAG: hypothetical protein AAF628_27240 [Planctomycetota bacterium]